MTPKLDVPSGVSQASSPPTERVVEIVELLGREVDRAFNLAEICRRLDISRATAHAILTTLAARDWVLRDPGTARYRLGPAVGRLAEQTDDRVFHSELEMLSAETGTPVYLGRRDGNSIVIVDVAGDSGSAPPIARGTRTPFVAPFGRDYVAWCGAEEQQAWMDAIGQPPEAFRTRMTSVLKEIRRRGFVVERLTREYVRTYTALQALTYDGEVDAITAQLARAFADLCVIDVLPGEFDRGIGHNIATVSAPITDRNGVVTMSVTTAPFAVLQWRGVKTLGREVKRTAQVIHGLAHGAGDPDSARRRH